MSITLLHGQFSKSEALDLVTRFVNIKIKFHENKISDTSSEEDSKMREQRIKQLQKDLYEFRTSIENKVGDIHLHSEIKY